MKKKHTHKIKVSKNIEQTGHHIPKQQQKSTKHSFQITNTTETFSNSTVPLILVNYIIDKEHTTLHRQLAHVGEWLESVAMV